MAAPFPAHPVRQEDVAAVVRVEPVDAVVIRGTKARRRYPWHVVEGRLAVPPTRPVQVASTTATRCGDRLTARCRSGRLEVRTAKALDGAHRVSLWARGSCTSRGLRQYSPRSDSTDHPRCAPSTRASEARRRGL